MLENVSLIERLQRRAWETKDRRDINNVVDTFEQIAWLEEILYPEKFQDAE